MTFDPTRYTIRYWADFNAGTGFNNAMRGYLGAMRTLGIDSRHVHLAPALTSDFGSRDADLDDWVLPYIHRPSADDVVAAVEGRGPPIPERDTDNEKINIVHLSPGMLAAKGFCTFSGSRYNIAVTAWETDTLPERELRRDREHIVKGEDTTRAVTVVEALNDFDQIWVPTEWNAETFKRCGVTKPVHVVPHALLPELMSTPLGAPPPGSTTRFYTIGTWNARKDPAMILQAYFASGWTPLDPVDLQLYCVPPERDHNVIMAHQGRAEQERMALLDSSVDPTGVPQHGMHTAGYVSYHRVLERHAQGHIYVSASHGEGAGLPLIEAAAMGAWIIAGGPWVEELAEVAGRFENGGLVDVLPARAVAVTPMPDEAGGYEVGAQWYSITTRDLLVAMKAAHEARSAEGMGQAEVDAAERVREWYGPERIGAIVRERLREAHEVLDGSGW